MSVPEVVREVITRNRSIYDCMKMDLINYTALAVKIQPEIEKILGNSVNLNTVVVAIKRYADSFEIKEEIKEESVLKNARLALTDGIMDVRFSVKDSNEMDPMSILDKFSKVTNNYEFFRLSDSFRFLTEDMEIMSFLDYLIHLDFLQKIWKTLDKFSIVFQKEKICLVQVLQKLEFQFLVLKTNQMLYHMLQKYYMQMV